MLEKIGDCRSFKNMMFLVESDKTCYARLPQWAPSLYVQFKYSEEEDTYMHNSLICYDKEQCLFKTTYGWTTLMPIFWALSEDWEIYENMNL